MAETITGTLADYATAPLGAVGAEVVFVPSGPGVGGAVVYAARSVRVTVAANGTFTASLQATPNIRPAVWLEVYAEYLDAAGKFIRSDYIGRLEVPYGGGTLATLVGTYWNPGLAWWATSSPPGTPVVRALWLDPITGVLKIWS